MNPARHIGPRTAGADPGSFDGFAADYDRLASLELPRVRLWLMAHIPRDGGRALDAGCGSGRHTLAIAEHFDDVVGLDISPRLIDIARRRRPHSRVRYEVGDLLAFTDRFGFDLVFSSTTLHHLPDLDGALHHLRGLVRPGGTAILIDSTAPWPTPPRWVNLLGAVREAPGDLRRHGWQEARWLFAFRTSPA